MKLNGKEMVYKLGDQFTISGIVYRIICITKIPKKAQSTVVFGRAYGWSSVNWDPEIEYEYGWKLMDVTGLKSVLYKTEEELQEIELMSTKLAELL